MSNTPFDGRDETASAERQTAASALGEQGTSPADQIIGSPLAAEDGSENKSGGRTRGGKFKPGRSGNPRGRPPKPKELLNDVFLRVLHEPVPVSVSGKQEQVTIFEALIRSTLVHAVNEPRVSLSVIKLVLLALGPPKAAETQDNDEQEVLVLERFRARELERLRLIVANDAHTSSENRGSRLDVDGVEAE